MRQLKFRQWQKATKHYVYFSLNKGVSLKFNIEPDLEQYTGLKDKNGKEIYEGDIIHRGALSKANVFRNAVIRFDKESVGFIATSTRNGARVLFNGDTCDEINVIGNIHENGVLLNDEKD